MLIVLLLLTAHTLVNALLLRRPERDRTTHERVAVLLPLRDEADRVTSCLHALLAQRGVPNLTIHVLDDGSTDGTAEIVGKIGGDRTRLLTGTPPLDGWLGKPNACRQLADDASSADVLVFIDADVVLEPDAIAGAVNLLRSADVTLLSPYPKIVGAGRLVQPLLQWSWLTFLPLRGMERSPRPSLAAAGGQWLVLDRLGYQRAGGHAAVRDDILEDIGLARAVKRSGGRIALADGSRLAACRMYDSWRDLSDGYAKSLWASFGSAFGAASVVGLLLALYVAPLLFPAIALPAYLLGVTGRLISAAATGGRLLDAVTHPLSVLLFAWLVARSFHRRHRNLLTWKGRSV
ncbi:glycosyltransferase [Actinoplanes derwentensis]|uniref:Glycosyltransferase, catalytic subunit of cellulose synthase and poly-beta-1,6-N-acetylglucosamine synthase n=1 Tax=Actinoplanes derwentensis TaxID=113562 RepID=A0A1H2C155_9ACTN|nr:glycosyltransferase family 2 protein [Actinoplanes derwentensis]GID84650.1 glycosyl transferase [Actinoplanes derwentensis]SDT63909.1 Glycosyltransferase, catalytic subunit of cellulose synthase and poly-beta-1,6-N-acetylglucosamine synthase [Actinoplanes derwentensis]